MGNNEQPFFIAYFGRQHSGKTYDLQRFVDVCGKPTIFVYNSGRDEDWEGYEEIELFSDPKTRVLYFRYKDEDYEWERMFMRKFRNKRVKAPEADEILTETLLFRQLKRKGAHVGLFFIMDDSTGILSSRLTKPQKSCFSRAKHVGVWFALIHHDPNAFPNGAWGLLTMAKFFKNNVPPPKNKADKIPHFQEVVKAYNKLKIAPDYSYCTLLMNTGQLIYTEFKQPSKLKK